MVPPFDEIKGVAHPDPNLSPENIKQCEGYGMKHTTQPVPGDVVVFADVHIGIYIGDINGKQMYISANHGGPDTKSADASTARVDIQTVNSRGITPQYFHYNGEE